MRPSPEQTPSAPGGGDEALTRRFYGELREIAERLFAAESTGHTLQPTAVVHEACLRMMTSSPPAPAEATEAPQRADRLALGARVLKQVLIDHHRGRSAQKRGGGAARVELELDVRDEPRTLVDVEAVHAALARLEELHPRQAEVVTLRIFGGLTMEQVAATLETSKRTVEGDWTVARAWLRRELAGEAPGGE